MTKKRTKSPRRRSCRPLLVRFLDRWRTMKASAAHHHPIAVRSRSRLLLLPAALLSCRAASRPRRNLGSRLLCCSLLLFSRVRRQRQQRTRKRSINTKRALARPQRASVVLSVPVRVCCSPPSLLLVGRCFRSSSLPSLLLLPRDTRSYSRLRHHERPSPSTSHGRLEASAAPTGAWTLQGRRSCRAARSPARLDPGLQEGRSQEGRHGRQEWALDHTAQAVAWRRRRWSDWRWRRWRRCQRRRRWRWRRRRRRSSARRPVRRRHAVAEEDRSKRCCEHGPIVRLVASTQAQGNATEYVCCCTHCFCCCCEPTCARASFLTECSTTSTSLLQPRSMMALVSSSHEHA